MTRIGNGSLAQMPGSTVKCNDSASAANVTDCSHIAFFLHKNNVNQTGMTTGAYQRVTFSTARFNSGGGTFASNTWKAPVAGFVQLSFFTWWTAHAANSGSPTYSSKIIKNSSTTCNGSDVFAGQGAATLGFTGTAIATASGMDQAAAGDVYELCSFGTSDDSMNDLQLDGNPAHTYFTGAFIR